MPSRRDFAVSVAAVLGISGSGCTALGSRREGRGDLVVHNHADDSPTIGITAIASDGTVVYGETITLPANELWVIEEENVFTGANGDRFTVVVHNLSEERTEQYRYTLSCVGRELRSGEEAKDRLYVRLEESGAIDFSPVTCG